MNYTSAFTIVEIIIVLIIISILATVIVPAFYSIREDSFDKEAWAALQVMSSAQRTYNIEMGTYYSSDDISDINDYLNLDLNEAYWDYSCTDDGCVQATRTGSERTWTWCLKIGDLGGDPIGGETVSCPDASCI